MGMFKVEKIDCLGYSAYWYQILLDGQYFQSTHNNSEHWIEQKNT